jgi:hypothetical protein
MAFWSEFCCFRVVPVVRFSFFYPRYELIPPKWRAAGREEEDGVVTEIKI